MLAPLGSLTEDEATEIFAEQIEGLREGGADVVWIETMSALEEARAAARAAIAVGAPYTATASFDTAGRTMMGLAPADFARAFDDLAPPPLAVGANCGVGAADLVVSVLAMTEANPEAIVIAKANAGLPQWHEGHIHYSGSPELMGRYAALAIDAGARIVGGCCGNTPAHVAAMRRALDEYQRGPRPDLAAIEAALGKLARPPGEGRRRGRRRRVSASPVRLSFVATAEDAGERLDRFVEPRRRGGGARTCRARVSRALIEAGEVRSSTARPTDPDHKSPPATIEVLTPPPPEESFRSRAKTSHLAVVYEDEHLIVIDKPAGLVVHPGAGPSDRDAGAGADHHCGASLSGIGGVRRPGIVHRLDKDTSGLMVVAKTDAAHHGLAERSPTTGRGGSLQREYAARCRGAFEAPWREPSTSRARAADPSVAKRWRSFRPKKGALRRSPIGA